MRAPWRERIVQAARLMAVLAMGVVSAWTLGGGSGGVAGALEPDVCVGDELLSFVTNRHLTS